MSKEFIELKYHKNSKQEIVFENLNEIKEGDNVLLKGNSIIEAVITLINNKDVKDFNLFIPYLDLENAEYLCCELYNNNNIDCYCFDLKNSSVYQSILPKWNIPEDSAILFLNLDDYNKYFDIVSESIAYFTYPNIENEDDLPQNCYNIGNYKHISIIAPELHAENKSCPYHIENINKICKELKEKYGVKRIELFVSHCFICENNLMYKYGITKIKALQKEFSDRVFIDKITTTNSTGILEVQKSDRLEVIDVVEFFKESN